MEAKNTLFYQRAPNSVTVINPLTTGAAYVRVFIFY